MKYSLRLPGWLVLATLVLAGCGGGGGGSAGGVTATVAPSLVNGTAATGAAIVGGKVTLKCQNGTSTVVTTGADGGFSIDVAVIGLPCIGRVEYTDSKGATQHLHTLVTAAGKANITPITDLLVAKLTGGRAADAFDLFNAATTKGFTAVQIKSAGDGVRNYLKNTLGLDTSALPEDLVGTPFVPKIGTTAGDAADQVLDALQAKLGTLGKTLAEVAGDVVKAAPTPTVTAGSAIGKGAYVNVTAEANAAFLALLPIKCVKDTDLSNAENIVYKNCNHSNLDPAATSLIVNMFQGALPNDGTLKNLGGNVIPNSGPGVATAATVMGQSGLSGVSIGQSCKIQIVEPFIPFIALKTNDLDNYQAGGSSVFADRFNFRGTAGDLIFVTPGGVVSQFAMTDTTGSVLAVQFDTSTGKATGSVTNGTLETLKSWACG